MCVCVGGGGGGAKGGEPYSILNTTRTRASSLRGDEVKDYLAVLSNDAEEVPVHKTVVELHDGGMVQL